MDYALLLRSVDQAHPTLGSRQARLHQGLRLAILDGQLAAGAALPPSRQLAADLGVARNMVLYAYEQLAAEALVRTEGRRTRVAPLPVQPRAEETLALPLSRRALSLSEPLDGVDGSYFVTPGLDRAFVPGLPDLPSFPLALWRRLLDRAWRDASPPDLGYAGVQGDASLRDALAQHLRANRGLRCSAAQLFITDGTQQSLQLCASVLADAGDTAWLEDPGYGGALTACQSALLKVVGKPVDGEGLRLTDADWRHPPKLVYLTPSHQYPLGSVLSLPRRLALIANARRHGSWILEDDYDSEFRHTEAPLHALQGLEPAAPVFYLGTFSKTLLPALRTGYIVVPAGMVAPFAEAMSRLQPRGRMPEQRALAALLHSGAYLAHLRRMRRLYRERREALLAALQQEFGESVVPVGHGAGLHLCITLPQGVVDVQASARAAVLGVVARPLSQHQVPGCPHGPLNGLVLGYGHVRAQAMDRQVRLLARAVRETSG
ncbi:PLP-dependent aminotransferase family protein [Ideonella azotifigens]|uniref:PLP-dependent aminotransferase family protein n=1 Tax=Ideonella azotifigens TaxID=513160 RepID=A0ABP3UZT4_9BURK|nr:PLP-dependent aminotransferase family protein [Ideonella azotifigens]MCD2340145.1 PLP-dependent aminotransferase family protein [Ideonella azotifigens]